MMTAPKLAIGIPYGARNLKHDVGFSWLGLVWPSNVNRTLYVIPGQPVEVARELCALNCIRDNVRYLLFLDDDVEVPQDTVRRLLTTLKRNPEAGAVGGVYYQKITPTEPVVYRRNGEGASWDWTPGDIFEVEGIGTGCLLIDCEVFKKIPRPWFQWVEEGGVTLGEDIGFCNKLREAGYKVLCDSNVLCVHHNVETGESYRRPA